MNSSLIGGVMNRKDFLRMGCCAAAFLATQQSGRAADNPAPAPCDDSQLKFIQNWLSDLVGTIDSETDEATKIKLMSGCGRACYRRHPWKHEIAAKGKGDVDKLVTALKANFEAWREGTDKVHIRYGEVNGNGCYCPAAKYRPGSATDMHCYCTRAMHEAIWEAALGKPVKIDILESVRRGGKTCHFLVHLT